MAEPKGFVFILFLFIFLSFRIFSDALGLLMGVRLQLVLLTGMWIFVWFMQCLYSMIIFEVHAVCLCCRFVHIWDTTTRRILYKLPGHAGSVNEVAFHPEEPIGKNMYFIKLLSISGIVKVAHSFHTVYPFVTPLFYVSHSSLWIQW